MLSHTAPSGIRLARFPVDNPIVTQPFKLGQHNGIDFRARAPVPLFACGQGVVFGVHPVDDNESGKHCFVRGTGPQAGIVWSYSHMSEIDVEDGQAVSADDVVGLSGNTGLTSGPHLHFVTMRDISGQPSFDPVAVLPDVPLVLA